MSIDWKFIGSLEGRRLQGYVPPSGKSGVTVEGTVKAADGTVLATFTQRRVGVMGVAGGDSMKKLESDAKDIGEDLANFLSAWGKGKKLK